MRKTRIYRKKPNRKTLRRRRKGGCGCVENSGGGSTSMGSTHSMPLRAFYPQAITGGYKYSRSKPKNSMSRHRGGSIKPIMKGGSSDLSPYSILPIGAPFISSGGGASQLLSSPISTIV